MHATRFIGGLVVDLSIQGLAIVAILVAVCVLRSLFRR